MLPTIERLRELLSYDPESGVLKWLVRTSNRVAVGDVAGRVHRGGRIDIGIDGRILKAHRVAWAIYYGKWPDGEIDHDDGDPGNNRIKNLKDCSHSDNMQNRASHKNNTSGFVGAHKNSSGRWFSKIGVNWKTKYLGSFDTPEQASAAYLAAKSEMHNFYPGHRGGESSYK